MASRREADHERAQRFAASMAVRPSTSELTNLARSYINARASLTEMARELAELHDRLGRLTRAHFPQKGTKQ